MLEVDGRQQEDKEAQIAALLTELAVTPSDLVVAICRFGSVEGLPKIHSVATVGPNNTLLLPLRPRGEPGALRQHGSRRQGPEVRGVEGRSKWANAVRCRRLEAVMMRRFTRALNMGGPFAIPLLLRNLGLVEHAPNPP